MEIIVVWVVMPYNLVGTNVLEERTAPVFRAILMPIYHTAWHITEDSNLEFL
jgi:hypothetical protein